jgi:hypothetical protein
MVHVLKRVHENHALIVRGCCPVFLTNRGGTEDASRAWFVCLSNVQTTARTLATVATVCS